MISFKGVLSFFRRNLLFQRESSRLGRWKRTYDIYGHKPDFEVICRLCDAKTIFRLSEIFPERSRTIAIEEGLNHVAYKCPRCHLMYKFFVPDSTEYLMDIFKNKRDCVTLYLPPRKEWEAENKEIKERLKLLGYM